MSVSVKDLLELPSLMNAKVIAGKKGLNRIVAAVSVLETIDYNKIDDTHTYTNDEFNGSEIVITGFLNAVDNFQVQYESVRRLALFGEAGLILYYVGSYVKKIDKRILQLADEMNFPIICMPENNTNLRYGEAISDIMGLIIRNQISGQSLAISLIESISRLPGHQQNVSTMAKLLSGRIHCCVVLTNDRQQVLYEAVWPSNLEGIHKQVALLKPSDFGPNPLRLKDLHGELVYYLPVQASDITYRLYIVSAGGPVAEETIRQSAETMRVALKLWGKGGETAHVSEIVSAILMDEPIKMRSLSSMFHVDIASVNNMWIIGGKELSVDIVSSIVSAAKNYCGIAFADVYKSEIVLFTDQIRQRLDVEALRDEIETCAGDGVTVSYFPNQWTTSAARAAYLLYSEYRRDLTRILPDKRMFLAGDVEFVKYCRHMVDSGNETVSRYLDIIRFMDAKNGTDSLSQTLCTFLLDCNSNVQKTADRLFVHKNTIKYRIKIMGDYFGFVPGSMPESTDLYTACGVMRLIG